MIILWMAVSVVFTFLSNTLACFIHLSICDKVIAWPSDCATPNFANALNHGSNEAIFVHSNYSRWSRRHSTLIPLLIQSSESNSILITIYLWGWVKSSIWMVKTGIFKNWQESLILIWNPQKWHQHLMRVVLRFSSAPKSTGYQVHCGSMSVLFVCIHE